MPKQPFQHKANAPRRGANPKREQHGEKAVAGQKELVKKSRSAK